MSEKVTMAVAGMGYGGYWTPFTEVQRRELEQQAMIYKYMVNGLPVPPDLVTPIRHGFDGFPSHIFNNSVGYCSYYGKKFDTEPGRCRRTDGKKWRCSKDAHPDSKYCERHMNRGRNRSRKPVESLSTSHSVLAAIPHSPTGCGSNYASSQQMPVYSVANPERSSFGSNVTKLQMGPVSYGMNSKEFSFSEETPARVGSLGLDSSAASASWSLAPSQVSSRLQGSSYAQQYTPHALEPINASLLKQQQHGLFGSGISSSATLKQDQHPVHLFLNEWPSNKESWSNLDNDGPNQNTFSSTQLSISTPRPPSDFSSGTAYATNDT